MKLTILFSFLVFTVSWAESYSQSTALSMNLQNVPVKRVIDEIEDQTDYYFLYQDEVLDNNQRVTIRVKDAALDKVISQLEVQASVVAEITENQIVLKRRPLDLPAERLQQEKQISGFVSDADGQPLPGVSVAVKGTTTGTVTDAEGEFSLRIPENAEILQFSFIGMKTQEVTIGDQTTFMVTMEPTTIGLSEVVVTSALGFKRQKRSMGIPTQKIEGEDVVRFQAPSIVTGLAGKAAGVNVTVPSGVEGGSQRIVIRGNNSITGNNQPLFIIDGIPVENSALVNEIGTGGGIDWGSSLNNINPYDIEEYNVLKGPAAAALYGARGANGVIIINTKKGRLIEKGIGIEYSVNHRWNNVYRYQEMQNEYGFGGPPGTLWEIPKLYTNSNGQLYLPIPWGGDRPVYGAIPGGYNSWDLFSWYGSAVSWGAKMEGQNILWWDGEMRSYSPQPDNREIFYKPGYTTTHNISFSGGGKVGDIRFSLTRTDNDAVVHNSNFQQTSANLGSNIRLSKKLSAKISTTYTDYKRLNAPELGGGGNTLTKGIAYSYPRSWQPHIDFDNYKLPDGSRNNLSGYPYGNIEKFLWWKIFEDNTELIRNQLLSSVELTLNATSWLDVMARLGVDYSTNEMETRNSPTDVLGIDNAYYMHSMTKNYVQNMDAIATAHKDDIIEGINVSGSVGATMWYRRQYGLTGRSLNKFKDPYLYAFNNYDGAPLAGRIPLESRYEKQINSVYAFVNLSYNNLLFLDVTGRNDWSSTLPFESNSYFYPSVSSSFVFTEVANLPSWLNYGKLRLAFAQAATDADPYQVTPTFTSGNWGGKATASMPTILPPIELMPQISKTMDYGLELEFMESRLNFDFTYYNTKTENQILQSPIPWSSGMNQVKINTGSLQNQGIELSVTGVLADSRDFGWTVTLNSARNRNKLLALAEGADEIALDAVWGNFHGVDMAVKVGEEYGVIRGKNKVYHENGQPIVDLFYAKGSTTEVIGAGYRPSAQPEIIGNAAPKFTGGLSNMLRYKDFSLSFLMDYKWGGDIWNGDYATARMAGLSPETLEERNGGGLPYTYPSGETANHGVIIEGVLEDGTPNTEVVHHLWKYGRNGWSMGLFPQTDGIMENTWVKMREVGLTWNMPADYVQKTKIFQGLSVTLVGRDLFYLYTTLPDKINPEGINGTGNSQGLLSGATPGQRSFGFSVRAIF